VRPEGTVMDPERFDRFSQMLGTAARRRSFVSLLAPTALGAAALGQSGRPAAAVAEKRCQCKQDGAGIAGFGEAARLLSTKVVTLDDQSHCRRDAADCAATAAACQSFNACRSAFINT